MSVKVQVLGKEEFNQQMRGRTDLAIALVNAAIDRGIVTMHGEAVRSVSKVGKGRVYKRGKIVHIASAPGDPPAVDSGTLRANIVIVSTKRKNKNEPASFAARTVYAKWLEYGTEDGKIKARPFMKPAHDKHIESVKKDVEAAIKRGLKG